MLVSSGFENAIVSLRARDPMHNASRVREDRVGMGCKADFAANSLGFGKKFNAADRPVPSFSELSRAARSYAVGP